MFSLMLFIFLCFLGMLAVQFYMLRSQERLNRALRDEHAQMRVLLRAMESRLDALGCPAPKPVSYTHLDVYKRQLCVRSNSITGAYHRPLEETSWN